MLEGERSYQRGQENQIHVLRANGSLAATQPMHCIDRRFLTRCTFHQAKGEGTPVLQLDWGNRYLWRSISFPPAHRAQLWFR